MACELGEGMVNRLTIVLSPPLNDGAHYGLKYHNLHASDCATFISR